MNLYKKLLRPLLFRIDAETAHELAKMVLTRPRLARILTGGGVPQRDGRLAVRFGGLPLESPVGLGAGFDKDCEMVPALRRLGFGFIVTGSVMSGVRPGNPRPRMVRDLEGRGLYSCMGLPSKGVEYAAARLSRLASGGPPLIVNFNAEDFSGYMRCAEVLGPFGDAVEVSLSCPNDASDAGEFLRPERARELLAGVAARTEKPVFVKMPGYESGRGGPSLRRDLVAAVADAGVSGITVMPDMVRKEKALSIGQGTLTGAPALAGMLRVVSDVYAMTGGKTAIKATGGVFSAEDAFRAIAAGATVVEVMTGFGFEGWGIARDIGKGLSALLDRTGIAGVEALRGTGGAAEGKG